MLEYGYTPFEIAYANIMIVGCGLNGGTLGLRSIVSKKIVVDLFQQVLVLEDALEEETYARLSEIFERFKDFHIRCYGHNRLHWLPEQKEEGKSTACLPHLISILCLPEPLEITRRPLRR